MNTESDSRLISYKGIRGILVKNVNGSISKESVEFLQTYFEELIQHQLKVICGNVLVRNEEVNKLREFHGLPEHKRFSLSIFLSTLGGDLYSSSGISGLTKEEKHNNHTLLSKANKEVTEC